LRHSFRTGLVEGIVSGATMGESSYIEEAQSAQVLSQERIEKRESENRRLRDFIDRREKDIADYEKRQTKLRNFFKSQP
jgi:hypothetical protein